MWRLYLVPITHVDLGGGKEFAAPAYFSGRLTTGLAELVGATWTWERYVWENHGIVAADLDTTQDALLSGQTDVIAVPALDNTIPNLTVRNRVRTILEGGNIPGTWVNVGMTYREVVRGVLGVFRFHSRLVSKIGKVFGSVTLDTTVSQLSANAVNKLQETANEFGLDYSQVTGATTVRQILKGMADQFGNIEYQLGGMVI